MLAEIGRAESQIGFAGQRSASVRLVRDEMDLRHLRYFITVAEELSFTRAAEKLNTVQPSLSAQIRRLEEMIGARLFYRTSHHVELTPAGMTFLEESRKIVADIERAIERTQRSSRSNAMDLSVGFVSGLEGVILPEIISNVQRQNPEIQVHIYSSTDSELLTTLRRHGIDMLFGAPIEDPEVAVEIASEVVFRMEMIAIVPSDYGLGEFKRVPVSMLAGKPLIWPLPGKYPFAEKSLREVEAQAGIRFSVGGYADGALATVNAVISGAGFGLVPDFMTSKIPPSVLARPLDLPDPPQSPILVSYRRNDESPALKLFLAFLRDYVREHGNEVSSFKKSN
jgi:LysR family transcriptional regulator, hca operon transcriptional activator